MVVIDDITFSDTGKVSIGVSNNRLFKISEDSESDSEEPEIIKPIVQDINNSLRILAADDTGHDLLSGRLNDNSSFVKKGALGYLMTGDIIPDDNQKLVHIFKSELNSNDALGNDIYTNMTSNNETFENRVAAAFEVKHDLQRAIVIVTYNEIIAGVTIIGKPQGSKIKIKINQSLREIAERSNGSLQITTDLQYTVSFYTYLANTFQGEPRLYEEPMRKISYFINWYLHDKTNYQNAGGPKPKNNNAKKDIRFESPAPSGAPPPPSDAPLAAFSGAPPVDSPVEPNLEETEVEIEKTGIICDGGSLIVGKIFSVDDSLVTPVIEPSVIGDSAGTSSEKYDPNIEIETKIVDDEHQLVPVVSNYFSAKKMFMCYVDNDGVNLVDNLYGFSFCFVKFDHVTERYTAGVWVDEDEDEEEGGEEDGGEEGDDWSSSYNIYTNTVEYKMGDSVANPTLSGIVEIIRATPIKDQDKREYNHALDAMLSYIKQFPNKIPRYYFGQVQKDADDDSQCGTSGAGVAYIGQVMNAVTDILHGDNSFNDDGFGDRDSFTGILNRVKDNNSSHRIPIADARLLKMFPDLTREDIQLIYDIVADYKRFGDYQQAYTALKRILKGRRCIYSSGDELSALIARLLGVPTILQLPASGKCILYRGNIETNPDARAAAIVVDRIKTRRKFLTKCKYVFENAEYITKTYRDITKLTKQKLKKKIIELIELIGVSSNIRTLLIIVKLYGGWLKLDEFITLDKYEASFLSDAEILLSTIDADDFDELKFLEIKSNYDSMSTFVNRIAYLFPFMTDKTTVYPLIDKEEGFYEDDEKPSEGLKMSDDSAVGVSSLSSFFNEGYGYGKMNYGLKTDADDNSSDDSASSVFQSDSLKGSTKQGDNQPDGVYDNSFELGDASLLVYSQKVFDNYTTEPTSHNKNITFSSKSLNIKIIRGNFYKPDKDILTAFSENKTFRDRLTNSLKGNRYSTKNKGYIKNLNDSTSLCETLFNKLLKSYNLPFIEKEEEEEERELHLLTFKTPLFGAVMSDEGDADWPSSMANGVKTGKIDESRILSKIKGQLNKDVGLFDMMFEGFHTATASIGLDAAAISPAAASSPAAAAAVNNLFDIFDEFTHETQVKQDPKKSKGVKTKVTGSKNKLIEWIQSNSGVFNKIKQRHSYTKDLLKNLQDSRQRDYVDDALIIDLLVTFVYQDIKTAMVELQNIDGTVIKRDPIGDYTEVYRINLVNSGGNYSIKAGSVTPVAPAPAAPAAPTTFTFVNTSASNNQPPLIAPPATSESFKMGRSFVSRNKRKKKGNDDNKGGGIQSGGATFEQLEKYGKLQDIVMTVLEKCYSYLLNVNAFADFNNIHYLEYLIRKNFTKDMARKYEELLKKDYSSVDVFDVNTMCIDIRTFEHPTEIYKYLLGINSGSSLKLDISQIAKDKNKIDIGHLDGLQFNNPEINKLLGLMTDKFEVRQFCGELLIVNNSVLLDEEDPYFSLRTALFNSALTDTLFPETKHKIPEHIKTGPVYYDYDQVDNLDVDDDEIDFKKLFGIGIPSIASAKRKSDSESSSFPPLLVSSNSSTPYVFGSVSLDKLNTKLIAEPDVFKDNTDDAGSSVNSPAVKSLGILKSIPHKNKYADADEDDGTDMTVSDEVIQTVSKDEDEYDGMFVSAEVDPCKPTSYDINTYEVVIQTVRNAIECEVQKNKDFPSNDVYTQVINGLPGNIVDNDYGSTITVYIMGSDYTIYFDKYDIDDIRRFFNTQVDNQFNSYQAIREYFEPSLFGGDVNDIFELPNMTIQEIIVNYDESLTPDQAVNIWKFFKLSDYNKILDFCREKFRGPLEILNNDTKHWVWNRNAGGWEVRESEEDDDDEEGGNNEEGGNDEEGSDFDKEVLAESYDEMKVDEGENRKSTEDDDLTTRRDADDNGDDEYGDDYGDDYGDEHSSSYSDEERDSSSSSSRIIEPSEPSNEDILRTISGLGINELYIGFGKNSDYDTQICKIWIFFNINPDKKSFEINNDSIDIKFIFFVDSGYNFYLDENGDLDENGNPYLDENGIPYWDNMKIPELLVYSKDNIDGGLTNAEIVYCRTNEKQRGSEEQEEQEQEYQEESYRLEDNSVILEFFKETSVAMEYINLLWSLLNNEKTKDLSGFNFRSTQHKDMPYSVVIFILGSLYPYFYKCIHQGKRSPTAMFTSKDNCAFDVGTISFMKAFIGLNQVSTRSSSSSNKRKSEGGSKTKRRNKKPYTNLKTRAKAKLNFKSSRKHRKSLRKHTFTQRHKF